LKKDELKKLSKSELDVKLNENQEALMNFRFQKVLQQLEKPQAIRSVKREIAQIKTVIRELELGIRGKEVK
jgi:large subunit ribosomal protein L29